MPLAFQKQQIDPPQVKASSDGPADTARWIDVTEARGSSPQLRPYASLSLAEREARRMEGLENMRATTKFLSTIMVIDWLPLLGGDERIQETFEGLKSRLFPEHMDRHKIKRVFRKISQNILGEGTSCESLECHDFDVSKYNQHHKVPHSIPWDNQHHKVPHSIHWDLSKQFPKHASRIQRLATWRDLSESISGIVGTPGAHDAVLQARSRTTRSDLGLPALGHRCDHSTILQEHLTSSDTTLFQDDTHELGKRDMVVVRTSPNDEYGGRRAYAFCQKQLNVVSLKKQFFSEYLHRNLLRGPIRPQGTTLADLVATPEGACQAYVFLHELMHTASSIMAYDQPLPPDEIAEYLDAIKHKRCPLRGAAPDPTNCLHDGTYGFEKCYILARLDDFHGTSRAEENADSWALLAALSSLVLLYPEFGFVKEDNGVDLREPGLLLHHCSAFDCLRQPSMGSILDLPGYDANKDPWVQRKYGLNRPRTVQECNDFLEELSIEQHITLQSILNEIGWEFGGYFCHAKKEKVVK